MTTPEHHDRQGSPSSGNSVLTIALILVVAAVIVLEALASLSAFLKHAAAGLTSSLQKS